MCSGSRPTLEPTHPLVQFNGYRVTPEGEVVLTTHPHLAIPLLPSPDLQSMLQSELCLYFKGTGHLHSAAYYSGQILHGSLEFGGWKVGEGVSPNASGLCGEEEIPVCNRNAAQSQSLH